jgi:hypothetical protein
MPVSFVPLVLPVIFVAVLVFGATRGTRAFLNTLGVVAGLAVLVIVPFYAPGWLLMRRAHAGDAAAMYELAHWHESHAGRVNEIIIWPFSSDVEAGYAELERSAAAGYTPAMYALGVRLKYGKGVPEPPGWTGPAGNVFPQPERGQPLIDQAIKAGFKPSVPEKQF